MNKKLLGVLGVAALLLAGNFAWQEVKEVDAAARTIYLNAGGSGLWDQAGAVFYGHFWGDGDEDVKFVDTDGDGVYEATITSAATDVIFTRCQPSSTGVWDKEWNRIQTKVPSDKNCFTITGWGASDGNWSSYTPSVDYVGNVLTLTGSMQGWNPADENYKFTDENEDHVYNYSLELAPGQHKFKIVKDLKWGTEWGYTALTKNGVPLTNDADDNCVLNTLGGTYDFEFDFASKTLTVTQTSNYSINQVMSHFYNAGSYTKDSVLNTNKIADTEIAKYFHAKADTKYRRTEYTPSGLTMTTSENGETYSDKKSIYTNGDNCVVHSGEVGGNYTYSTDKVKTVEDWFVTLYDFKEASSAGWIYENGVYTYNLSSATADSEAEMTRMAREFVAPMWLAPNEDNWAYARFDKLTVEANQEGQLVMKLYVEEACAGILVEGSNLVFSQVTIY